MSKNNVMSESWTGKGSAAPLAQALRSIGGVLNNPHGYNGIRVSTRGGRFVIEGQSQSSIDRSSFAFKQCEGDKFDILTGKIKWSGRGTFVLVDDNAANRVTITGGTELAPYFVSLRISSANGPHDAILICTATEPEDDGTYFYKTLYEVWLNEEGNAVCGQDRRPDWRLGSPI